MIGEGETQLSCRQNYYRAKIREHPSLRQRSLTFQALIKINLEDRDSLQWHTIVQLIVVGKSTLRKNEKTAVPCVDETGNSFHG
jgi:hypothetical protein